MTDRFPPLRPQAALMARSGGRTLPAPIDLTLRAALSLVVVLALI